MVGPVRRTAMQVQVHSVSAPVGDARLAHGRVMICLLGSFQVLAAGRPLILRGGGKVEALLTALALHAQHGLTRERLLDNLWPDGESALAGQSLNTLVYSVHRLLGPDLGGAAPVLYSGGWYRLNLEAGVSVDLHEFEALAARGDQLHEEGRGPAAAEHFAQAVDTYRGDLSTGPDMHSLVERERLRARYLNVLAQLADLQFDDGNFEACLETVLRLLAVDGCREDAHRQAMRCYVRRGERAQAMRQYRLCEAILASEFEATPEPATRLLFERVRLDPATV
jgi:DNA-binding SARP family transcriptional activator